MTTARQLWFTGPREVEIREQVLPATGAGEVVVRSQLSAISAGTEMLAYRGQLPGGLPLDAGLESLRGNSPDYPLQYGYATVGRVEDTGPGVDPDWRGQQVFAFVPHASHFLCRAEQLLVLPGDIEAEAAVFLPNMETALTLLLDGRPLLGERVLVLGQGIVGLLVTALLGDFPLTAVYTMDRFEQRRDWSRTMGADGCFDPERTGEQDALAAALDERGADLVFELSGAPEALNLAISLCGYASRIVIGSWYGSKAAPVDLGGEFHRNRIRISGSQVSSIAPALRGRWDSERRFEQVWSMLRQHRPQRLITHRMDFESAAETYRLLDEQPADILQAVFEYPA